MVVKRSQFANCRCTFAHLFRGAFNVFSALTASGIRTICRSEKRKSILDPIVLHLFHGFGQERSPVSVPPIDRQSRAVKIQFISQGADKCTVLPIYRTN